MPWTLKQYKVAKAVEHGWKPKGTAKGFDKDFAAQVVSEGVKSSGKSKKGKK